MKRLFTFASVALLATACLSESGLRNESEDFLQVAIDGVIDTQTKVDDNGFVNGDAVGLFAVNYENDNKVAGDLQTKGNQVDNAKYLYNEADNTWNSIISIYYKDKETNVDLYCYSPYSEISDVKAFKFEVKQDQNANAVGVQSQPFNASDFLWGKVEGVVPSNNAVKVTFRHKFACANVILEEGEGFPEGEYALLDKNVIMTNVVRKASIDLSTGVAIPVGEAPINGTIMQVTDNGFRAIAVPQVVEAGKSLFAITVGGQTYIFVKDENQNYIAGKMHVFTIKVNFKAASGEYEFVLASSEITDWKNDSLTHTGEARQYYIVNVQTPGTLGKLIREDSKNPGKIKNLKVLGTINTDDFYFMRDSMAVLEALNLKEVRIVHARVDKKIWNDDGNGWWLSEDYCDDAIPDFAFKKSEDWSNQNAKTTLFYLTLPDQITKIGRWAFAYSSISGALVIPDSVTYIGERAFMECKMLSSLSLPMSIEKIEDGAFQNCSSFSGNLSFPETLTYIGNEAFRSCSFEGRFNLPDELEYIGYAAFYGCRNLTGGVTVPDKIVELYNDTFGSMSSCTGPIVLNNVQKIGSACFSWSGFTGEVIIPEGVTSISERAFSGTQISNVVFPSTLKAIDSYAFEGCWRMSEALDFPKDLMRIGECAFCGCRTITGIDIKENINTIQNRAFSDCHGLSRIKVDANEPPTLGDEVFSGVGKDNLTVQVPENSVNKYQSHPKWSVFRRISAAYDFSINRDRSRSLARTNVKKYVLRAPEGASWQVSEKPDWVTVSPSSGIGKQEVFITYSEMELPSGITRDKDGNFTNYQDYPEFIYKDRFDWDEYGQYHENKYPALHRQDTVTFHLDGRDVYTDIIVEQYYHDKSDSDIVQLNKATKGNGVDIVLIGDGYDALDIACGSYQADIEEGFKYFFDIEPYKTYKDYFNVYMVYGESLDSGIGTLNTIKDTKFTSCFDQCGSIVLYKDGPAFEYACKAPIDNNLNETLVILVQNAEVYSGITYMYEDGAAIACIPKSRDAYPFDFRGVMQHEAGGHGFGKLGDEYIYHNAFINSCGCSCCNHLKEFYSAKSLGWFRNMEATGDMNEVGWSHLIFNPQFSDRVDVFEGGYFHTRGIFRSEAVSCMNNNIAYFSAISRQAIVERIMQYAGEEFTFESFAENDDASVGITKTQAKKLGFYDPQFQIPLSLTPSPRHNHPVIIKGKPDINK